MEPVLTENVMQINGEIVCGNDFECWNLCVCFYIEANENWTFLNNTNHSYFYGTTQKCLINKSDSAFFSTPFETQIKYKDQNILMDKWPLLYLKVLSFDSWNRFIFESYGFVELPKRLGRYSLTINTWKPTANNPIDRLKQFFIGSSPLLENIPHKNSCPSSDKCLNNYGLQFESSGSVDVTLNVLMQTECPQLIERNDEKMQSLSFSSMQQNILSVIYAFERAKKRMNYLRDEINKSDMS